MKIKIKKILENKENEAEYTSWAFPSESPSNYSRRPRRERNWGGRSSKIRK